MENSRAMSVVSAGAVVVALLQSLCAAVLTINGIRLAIGLAALAGGSIWLPFRVLHRDVYRIPMLIVAVAGAVLNLAVLAWIRHLRARPEAQWRRRELSKKQRRSERLQIALAVLTLLLVGTETWMHAVLHGHPSRQPVAASAAVKAPL